MLILETGNDNMYSCRKSHYNVKYRRIIQFWGNLRQYTLLYEFLDAVVIIYRLFRL